MIRREGDRMMVSGALTLASVAAALSEGNAAIGEGVRSVDLGEVGELDSSALALLLAWLREAKRQNREPRVRQSSAGPDHHRPPVRRRRPAARLSGAPLHH